MRRRSEIEEKPPNDVIRGGIVETPNVTARGLPARAGSPVKTRVRDFDRIARVIRGKPRFRAGGDPPEVVGPGDVMAFPAGTPRGGEIPEEAERIDVFPPPNPDFRRMSRKRAAPERPRGGEARPRAPAPHRANRLKSAPFARSPRPARSSARPASSASWLKRNSSQEHLARRCGGRP